MKKTLDMHDLDLNICCDKYFCHNIFVNIFSTITARIFKLKQL